MRHSTGEYNGWGKGVDMVDSRYNEDRSPVKTNPEKDFVKGGDGRTGPLRLAFNTAQMGRTFQDRSHKFRIVRRPDELPSDVVIHNLNVRGRRGNIVQVSGWLQLHSCSLPSCQLPAQAATCTAAEPWGFC